MTGGLTDRLANDAYRLRKATARNSTGERYGGGISYSRENGLAEVAIDESDESPFMFNDQGQITFRRFGLTDEGLKLTAEDDEGAPVTVIEGSYASGGIRVGLYGVDPVARASHVADASGTATGTDAALITDLQTKLNAVIAALENIGILNTT